ncbi:ATP-binding cassette domain-containing protein [Limosilactobacillus reuteri]|jgi:energy-coupling factor transporter ATP-binding protein EcfA2|uniref:ABC transporter ATP-binding protein n=2 Tax=Limosilactobacillus reuteri TaxID=1598 RepID=A0A0U5K5E6_LIMRT|nr:ABC transporter ATP-binding protein [Limosilactobacillus reuteri]AGN98536.1 cobalt ABC transporter ATP-binding component [Limosilactobacillus reuteri I5007]AMY14397.1 ABC transporter ATP-binding protein [Limosilactobacillus reuteri]MCC4346236.1 energy-coupling factor ABC transporter ATP-binding protein [Limosilactobacillus reuteri]MCC4366198.1 energy-coupling factor ABC transporter ATP-binding protein [Limosilactobacillus reuteri]MCC4389801.1 energy-coupling factor ABC transporter ATP-bindi
MKNIQFNDLSFNFDQQPILKNITAEFTAGKIHLLTGVSGSGKSTILKLIAGLLPKYGGEIVAGAVDVPTDARIGMVFQDPLMQFALDTPRHELEFTLENCQVPTDKIPERVKEALQFGKVDDLANRLITTLSGGQQQRVALAAATAMQPNVLLLDEPFANIDEENRQLILKQLVRLNSDYHTTIIITDHDLHGYKRLHPLVWQLTKRHLTQLSSKNSSQLLTASATPQITTVLPSSTLPAIIKFDELAIKRENHSLLLPTNLGIVKNKITLLTGPNGIGKSTLLKAIARLLKYEGKIEYAGENIQKISPGKYYKHLGLIFQHANDQFLNVTVGEELALGFKTCQNPYFNQQQVNEALAALGLNGREDQVVYSLSGGQKKKLQILLMLMRGQETLLLDEPFTGLDPASLKTVLQLIKASQKEEPQTLLIVSHQLSGLDDFIDYHLTMNHQHLNYVGGRYES